MSNFSTAFIRPFLFILGLTGLLAAVGTASMADLIADRLLIPVAEAARMLGCNRATLYRRHDAGRLELVRVGARTYVTRDELQRFMAEELEAPRSRRHDPAAPHLARRHPA